MRHGTEELQHGDDLPFLQGRLPMQDLFILKHQRYGNVDLERARPDPGHKGESRPSPRAERRDKDVRVQHDSRRLDGTTDGITTNAWAICHDLAIPTLDEDI